MICIYDYNCYFAASLQIHTSPEIDVNNASSNIAIWQYTAMLQSNTQYMLTHIVDNLKC